MAQNFSAALDNLFGLDPLHQAVEQRKKRVSTQTAELEALQARLQEIEAKLRDTQSGTPSPSTGGPDTERLRRWTPAKDATDDLQNQPSEPGPFAPRSPPSPRQ
ncbi:hypothetical protein MMC30_001177 [Trapelia coarctata]|nr:hypothetical protein [Trapelia coarctata]